MSVFAVVAILGSWASVLVGHHLSRYAHGKYRPSLAPQAFRHGKDSRATVAATFPRSVLANSPTAAPFFREKRSWDLQLLL